MSSQPNKNRETRHGKRAEGQTSITFTLPEDMKAELLRLAKAEKRSLSNFLAYHAPDVAKIAAERQQQKRDSDKATLGAPPEPATGESSATDETDEAAGRRLRRGGRIDNLGKAPRPKAR